MAGSGRTESGEVAQLPSYRSDKFITMNPPARLDPTRLSAYQSALCFAVTADGLAEGLPRGRAYLADQLRRAALSVVLNIAEGAGEFSADEKARFYRMAKRSGTECGAVIDVAEVIGLVTTEDAGTARRELVSVVSMLTRLVQSMEGRGKRERG